MPRSVATSVPYRSGAHRTHRCESAARAFRLVVCHDRASMDGLAPRTRRPDRSMVSFVPARPSERHVPGTGPVRTPERASHARALPAPDDASLTLGRRIGVLVVLGALGFAIVLAASGGGGGDRTSGIVAVPSTAVVAMPTGGPVEAVATFVPVLGAPTGQPTFVTPDATVVSKRKRNLQVRV